MKETMTPLPPCIEFRRPPAELIRTRVSTRAFSTADISPDARSALEEACVKLTTGLLGEPASFGLVTQASGADARVAISDYGFLEPSGHFLLGGVKKSPRAYESYGYLLEHLVLKATDVGLQTCWVGYFHPEYFGGAAAADEVFPAVVFVGLGRDRLKGRLIRMAVRASHRLDWASLFFGPDFRTALSPGTAGPLAEPLELLRLAPSSGNRQPWRVVADPASGICHFYLKPQKAEYLRRHLHDVDIGIALCHFELGTRSAGLSGRWVLADPGLARPEPDIDYRLSWFRS